MQQQALQGPAVEDWEAYAHMKNEGFREVLDGVACLRVHVLLQMHMSAFDSDV